MSSVGGFQSGFHARKIPRSEAKWPQFVICSHSCDEIVQLISRVSHEVEFELCAVEALNMAKVLAEQVGVDVITRGGMMQREH